MQQPETGMTLRGTMDRAWRALCAGRAPRVVAGRIAVALFGAGAAWTCACAFLLLEPLS